jgi:outer membrane protein, adhesin transport system
VDDPKVTLPRLWQLRLTAFVAAFLVALSTEVRAMTLHEAITLAVEANPEIGQAIANREAIEFELRQARGLWLPQVDLEARAGAQDYESPNIGTIGGVGGVLPRREANLVVQQLLFDGFNRRGEIEKQASRVDGASNRVFERSEFIALAIAREYLEVGRLFEVVAINEDNVTYHRRTVGQLSQAGEEGALAITDKQQAEERVYAAEARLIASRQELNAARIRFNQLVGKPIDPYTGAPSMAAFVPGNVTDVIGAARLSSPVVKIAKSDLDSMYGLKKQATSGFYPKVGIELRGRLGEDLEGVEGQVTDLRAEMVMRWNLYRGGIDVANWQEHNRRIDEARFALDKAFRDVEEAVLLAWNTRVEEQTRLVQLERQFASTRQLVDSYTEQFKVGERSLLDLLNTQNTKVNAQIEVVTAGYSVRFADYRLLASAGRLLYSLGINPPKQSDVYARDLVGFPGALEGDTQKRRSLPFSPD